MLGAADVADPRRTVEHVHPDVVVDAYGLVYEVRDGLITRMTIYPEVAEALEAAAG
jgi:hypothetical protein